MRGVLSFFRAGEKNLALEQALFEGSGEPVLLFWISDPCVVIGRNQNAYAEVNVGYCRKHSVPVLRRISGGGAVYHDGGNLNCSLILPRQEAGLSYDPFLDRYVTALRALGIPARRQGVCDVYLGEKKLCGTAQAARGSRTLTHATLLCRTDLKALSLALRPGPAEILGKGTPSVRVPVGNCGFPTEGLAEKIALEMGVERLLPPTEAEIGAMGTVLSKYNDFSWNYGKSLPFTVRSGNTVLTVRNGFICESDPEDLRGLPYLPESLPPSLADRFF